MNPKLIAVDITSRDKDGKLYISVEKLYQFAVDITTERQTEIRHEDEVSRIARGFSTVNLN